MTAFTELAMSIAIAFVFALIGFFIIKIGELVIDNIRFRKLKSGDVFINKHDIDNPFDYDKRYVVVMEKKRGKYNSKYIKYRRIEYDYAITMKSLDFFNSYKFSDINLKKEEN